MLTTSLPVSKAPEALAEGPRPVDSIVKVERAPSVGAGLDDPISIIPRIFSIRRVANTLGVSTSRIRYWQSRTNFMKKDTRSRAGWRQYRLDDFLRLLALSELEHHIGVSLFTATQWVGRLDVAALLKELNTMGRVSISRRELRQKLLHVIALSLSEGFDINPNEPSAAFALHVQAPEIK